MHILLDTNAYSALFRGHTELVLEVQQANKIFLSAIVVGELEFGFRNGTRYQENSQQLQQFMRKSQVEFLPVIQITTERFGRIATQLKQKGRPLPTNDIWIAAHTFETGAELFSFDHHFQQIDGLVWRQFV